MNQEKEEARLCLRGIEGQLNNMVLTCDLSFDFILSLVGHLMTEIAVQRSFSQLVTRRAGVHRNLLFLP